MTNALIEIAGTVMVALALIDVFLTVLVARSGTSIFSEHLISGTWRGFRFVGQRAGRYRDLIFATSGPLSLVLVIVVWILMLAIGFGLMVRPHLGSSLVASPGSAPPRGIGTAASASGSAMTTVGSAELLPQTPGMRWLLFTASAVGISTFTLTLTYLVQIYNALLQRNALNMTLHFATGCTGDAAEWIARLGANGDFTDAASEIGQIAGTLAVVYEAHHFYPSLLYFRFSGQQYSLARGGLIVLEATTFIRESLDDSRYPHFKRFSSIDRLHQCAMRLLDDLAKFYLPTGVPVLDQEPNPVLRARWTDRYIRAADKLRQAKIELIPDEAGLECYISARQKWEPYLTAFAAYMGHTWSDVAPADGDIAQAQS